MDTICEGITIHDHGQQVPQDAAAARAELEAQHGQVWSTAEMQAEFSVIGFGAPFVDVVRKSDGVAGYMQFTHNPRFYFGFRKEG